MIALNISLSNIFIFVIICLNFNLNQSSKIDFTVRSGFTNLDLSRNVIANNVANSFSLYFDINLSQLNNFDTVEIAALYSTM